MATDIKQRYRNFRQWQQKPFSYELKSEEQQHCANCHQEYIGNFCPYCSQKAGLGKVTWKSVAKGISLVWGMDSRSLLYSLWQLLLRPGYLIRDYINGERQASFPPVKMLLLVAIIYGLIIHWAGVREVPSDPDGSFEMMRAFALWFNKNPGWGQMIKCAFLILPTWLFFRYSPCNTRHTIAEGFYIQVFMTTLVLLIMIVADKFLGDWLYLIVLIYYIIAYHQLFGYGWWGSIWRTTLTGIEGFYLMLFVAALIDILYGKPLFETTYDIMTIMVVPFLVNAALVAAGYYISRNASLRAAKQAEQSLPQPQEETPQEDELQEDELKWYEPTADELLVEEPLEDELQQTEPVNNDLEE